MKIVRRHSIQQINKQYSRRRKGKNNEEMLPIDSEELIKAIYLKGFTLRDACDKLGVSHGYINHAARRGTINSTAVDSIEKVFCIPYSIYRPKSSGSDRRAACSDS